MRQFLCLFVCSLLACAHLPAAVPRAMPPPMMAPASAGSPPIPAVVRAEPAEEQDAALAHYVELDPNASAPAPAYLQQPAGPAGISSAAPTR